MQLPRIQHSWLLIGVFISMLFLTVGCLGTASMEEVHGFSNLVLDGDTLWVGAGYKLYRVDLSQRTATLVYDTEDVAISFIQIDGKRLFFGGSGSRKNVIWSLDLDNHKILWKQVIDINSSRGSFVTPPLIHKDVFMIGARQNFYGLDKNNGDIKWKIENNWFGTGDLLTPILVDDQLIYGDYKIGENGPQSDHTIAIADPFSGKTLRTILMPGRLGAIPALHGSCLFVKDEVVSRRNDLHLSCVDFDSGEIIWSVEGEGYPELSEIDFYDGSVFDIFADQLFAINEKTGNPLWKSANLDETIRNPQVIEDLKWIALETPESRKVIFLDLSTGELRDEALHNALSSPVILGREAIYGTTNAIVRVDIVTGKIIWSIPVDSHYFVRLSDD